MLEYHVAFPSGDVLVIREPGFYEDTQDHNALKMEDVPLGVSIGTNNINHVVRFKTEHALTVVKIPRKKNPGLKRYIYTESVDGIVTETNW